MLKYIAILIILLNANMCNKNILKLEKNKVYSVAEIINSSLFKSKCGSISKVENEIIQIRGKFSSFHFTPNTNQIILFDLINNDDFIEVRYTKEIADTITLNLKNVDNSEIQVTGLIIGYDQRKNFTCKRAYYIQVTKTSNLQLQ